MLRNRKIQKDAAPKGKRHKLYLQTLKFLSIVDQPAMEPATIALIKRAGAAGNDIAEFSATARIVKTSDELVWGWAFVSKHKGEAYTDLQGDELDEESMLEVAKQFMSGDRASDTQHDEVATGEVVFAMPMTADIAKAFNVETDTHGLMIAVRPAADVMKRIKAGELTGFSLGGTGIREAIAEKRADRPEFVAKAAALTGVAEGHQHLVDLDRQSGSTSYESSTPGGYGHCHPVVIDDGVVTIGMAHGHTHDAMTTADKRAPAVKAANAAPTPSNATTTRTTAQEPTMDKKLLKAFAALTDDQVAHYRGLDEEGREAFLAKSDAERVAIVKAAVDADPVEYTYADGRVIRKSHDPYGHAVAALKRADAAEATASVEKAAREKVELEKRAAQIFKNTKGKPTVFAAIVGAIEKHVTDEALRKECFVTLSSNDATGSMPGAFTAGGVEGGGAETGAEAQVEKQLVDFAKANNVSKEKALVELTKRNGPHYSDEFCALYDEAQDQRTPARRN